MERWIEMGFIIDGRADIQLAVPPAKVGPELSEPQFISTSYDSFQRMFLANYDPGWGRNRGLLLSRFASSIKRIEPKLSNDLNLSFEHLKNHVYLARAHAAKEFDIVGVVIFNDHPWLQVNLIGGYRKGIQYATVVNGEYILLISVSIFGENSDQTSLFPVRHETLRKIVNSVRFNAE